MFGGERVDEQRVGFGVVQCLHWDGSLWHLDEDLELLASDRAIGYDDLAAIDLVDHVLFDDLLSQDVVLRFDISLFGIVEPLSDHDVVVDL